MDFAFTPEQDAIRDTAERFAREKLAPGYQARARAGRLDRDLVREMGALGLIAPDLPEAYGGLAVDGVTKRHLTALRKVIPAPEEPG